MPNHRPQATQAPALLDGLIEGVREEWHWISLGLAGIGLVLVTLSIIGVVPAKSISGFIGCFLLLYGALIVLSRPFFSSLGRTLQARMHKAIVSSGVGFYGVMTLARFLQLELHDLLADLADFDPAQLQVRGLVMEWLIGFSVQSLMNSIDAFMWPLKLIQAHGLPGAGIVAGAAWGLYALGARVFPDVHSAIEKDADEAGVPELEQDPFGVGDSPDAGGKPRSPSRR